MKTLTTLSVQVGESLSQKNKIPEVFITKKAKNMNPGSPLFPTIHKLLHIYLIISLALASPICPRTREDCGGRSPQGDSILGSSRGTKGPHHPVQRAVDPSQPQHPAVPHQNGGPGLQPPNTDGPHRCHNRGNVDSCKDYSNHVINNHVINNHVQ